VTPTEGARIELWDAYVEGFGFRCGKKGEGTFFVRYRFGNTQQRHTLGRYPLLSLADARQRANDTLALVRSGVDPKATEKATKVSADKAKVPVRERTVEQAVADFLRLYPRHRASTRAAVADQFKRDMLPAIGNRPIESITRRDIARVVNAVSDRGAAVSANRLLSYMQGFFRWLVERGELDESPVKNLSKPNPERSRERVLTDIELLAVWQAGGDIGYPYGSLVRLLILTAQRRAEVANLRWADIDRAESLWTQPREMTKADRTHRVPLSPAAMILIDSIPDLGSPILFPATRLRSPARAGSPPRSISGWAKFKLNLDKRTLAHLQKAEDSRAKAEGRPSATVTMPPWTLHDIRRTVASGMAALGVLPHVIERLLNHSNGTIRGVAAVYNRHSYLPEMREALERWVKRFE